MANRVDVQLQETLDQLEWRGVRRNSFEAMCAELGIRGMSIQPQEWDEQS